MKKFTQSLAIAALAVVTIAPAAHALGTPKPEEFVTKASVGGMFEIESSKIALQRSTNTDVKAFAQHMIDDHTAASEKLKAAATQAGFASSVATTLDEKHQKMIDDLNKADADDFDDDYIDDQQKAHKKTVKLFKNYAEDGDNAVLKGVAAETLPTLEQHKTEVKALEDKVDESK